MLRIRDVEAEKEEKQRARLYDASQWQLIWRKFVKNRTAVIAGGIIILLYLTVAFAEFFAPNSPYTRDIAHPSAPPMRIRIFADGKLRRPFVYGLEKTVNRETFIRTYVVDKTRRYPLGIFVRGDTYKLWGLWEADRHLFGVVGDGKAYLLGTDKDGRDLLSRILYGGRLSLSIGLVGVTMSFFIGILVGSISGYFGGLVDMTIQRIIEVITSIPTLPLWMGLSAALPLRWTVVQVFFVISLILSLLSWPRMARVVRGKFLSLREEDFIVSARLDGVRTAGVMFRHMLPSFLSHIIAASTLAIPRMILAETALSFLGIGLRPPAISWGVLLQAAQNTETVVSAPWLFLPGAFVVIAVLAFNFFGDGLRDAADPYK
jgi:peptide/nickel transport system permease protein